MTGALRTFQAYVGRDEGAGLLEIAIDSVGVTQAEGPGEIDAMARDYIALALDLAPDAFGIEVHFDG